MAAPRLTSLSKSGTWHTAEILNPGLLESGSAWLGVYREAEGWSVVGGWPGAGGPEAPRGGRSASVGLASRVAAAATAGRADAVRGSCHCETVGPARDMTRRDC